MYMYIQTDNVDINVNLCKDSCLKLKAETGYIINQCHKGKDKVINKLICKSNNGGQLCKLSIENFIF